MAFTPIAQTSGGVAGAANVWTISHGLTFTAGDIITFACSTDTVHTAPTIPGYVQQGTTQDAPSTDSSLSVFTRTADGSEGTSFTVTFGGGTLETGAWGLSVDRGHDPAGTILVAQSAGIGATQTSPSVSPPAAGYLLKHIIGTDPSTTLTATPDALATERFDQSQSGFGWIYEHDYEVPSSGAITIAATVSASDNFARFAIAIPPDVGGGTPAPRMLGTLGVGT